MHAADDEERDLGQAGDQAERDGRDAGDPQRHACWRADLADDVGAHVVVAGRRVTIRPVATESSSAGICETRPSPIVSRL